MKKVILLAAALAFASPALAGQVYGIWDGVISGTSVAIKYDADGNGMSPIGIGTSTGLYGFRRSDTASSGSGLYIPVDGNNRFNAACADILEHAKSGAFNVVNVSEIPNFDVPPMGTYKADLIRELWFENYSKLFDGQDNDAVDRQAFQLAVWEVVWEDQAKIGNLTAGGAQKLWVASGAAAAKDRAEMWLGETLDPGTSGFAALAGLKETQSGDHQDFIVAIPVPGAALLGIVGLGVVGWYRRRIS